MKEKLGNFLSNNKLVVPILAGFGVYFMALSYEPSRNRGRFGAVGPEVNPILLGIGVALLVAAFVRYRINSNPSKDD